jgi:flagellar hook-basal body complex protein FliE
MSIDRISSAAGALASGAVSPSSSAAPSTGEAGFADTLRQLVGAADQSSGDANTAIGRMLEGSGDVHEAVIAMQKADAMLQLTVQVRNKLVQAYQDIMRMPV